MSLKLRNIDIKTLNSLEELKSTSLTVKTEHPKF